MNLQKEDNPENGRKNISWKAVKLAFWATLKVAAVIIFFQVVKFTAWEDMTAKQSNFVTTPVVILLIGVIFFFSIRKRLRIQARLAEESAEKEKLNQDLKNGKELYRQLVQDSNSVILRMSAEGKIFFLNNYGENLFGYEPNEAIGKNVRDIIMTDVGNNPDDRTVNDFLCDFPQNPKCYLQLELQGTSRNGDPIWITWANTPILDEKGNLREIMSIGNDVTAKKHAEEAYRNLLMNSPVGLYIAQKGRFLVVNQFFQNTTGYNEAELIGSECLNLVVEEMRADVYAKAVHRLKTGSFEPYEYMIKTKSRKKRWILETVARTKGLNGKDATIAHFVDITERKNLEQKFLQAQKMEIVGTLAGGIAHDFNNLLGAIIGYCELIHMDMDQSSSIYAHIENIMSAALRAAALTNKLLTFSRRQSMKKQVLSVNCVIADTTRMLEPLIGEDIKVSTSLCDDLRNIVADSSQVQQVVLNLALNARDAMPKGGDLRIATKNQDPVSISADDPDSDPAAKYVMLSVSDSGTGMDERVRSRLFEPFFTTKPEGKGTGLGLSTVYGIVQRSGGWIEVESILGEGTTFRIYFPAVDKAIEVKTIAKEKKVFRGSGTVLVVEDVKVLQDLTRRLLEKIGFKAEAANDGVEALRICEERLGQFDLILTDIVMPNMTGKELADIISVKYPKIKILLMTGYEKELNPEEEENKSPLPILPKPFHLEELAQKIKEVLEK